MLIHVNLLSKPRAYDLVLPYSEYGTVSDPPAECKPPNFVVGWYRDDARGVTAASLIVNLREERVIQIMTAATRHVTSWVQGLPHAACPYPKNI